MGARGRAIWNRTTTPGRALFLVAVVHTSSRPPTTRPTTCVVAEGSKASATCPFGASTALFYTQTDGCRGQRAAPSAGARRRLAGSATPPAHRGPPPRVGLAHASDPPPVCYTLSSIDLHRVPFIVPKCSMDGATAFHHGPSRGPPVCRMKSRIDHHQSHHHHYWVASKPKQQMPLTSTGIAPRPAWPPQGPWVGVRHADQC